MDEALSLALEHDLPYTGLRTFEPDRRLFRYVPLAECQRRQVLPLVLVGDALKLASARPDPDLDLLEQRFPYLSVDIVLSPAAEIQAALQRAQGPPA